MKKLILILALGLALAACVAETLVPTATLVPLTVTPAPPTATPIPPTITPDPWDAKLIPLATGLHELPHLNSQVMKTLLGGTKVDLLATTEDKEWVQVTAYVGVWEGVGWLQVSQLWLNVSLDDLEVDTETAFVLPPTRTPGPTEVPLAERYIAHFVEKGFKVHEVPGQYMFPAGRGWIVVAVIEEGPMFGHTSFTNWTEEERTLIFDHLQEAATFLDPNEGWFTVLGAIDAMSKGMAEGMAHTTNGREVFFRQVFSNGTAIVTFTFMDVYGETVNGPISIPNLTSDPNSGPIPTIYVFTLSEFPPNESVNVTIFFRPTMANIYQTTVTVNENGEGEFNVTSEASDPKGEYLVVAVATDGSSAEVLVTIE